MEKEFCMQVSIPKKEMRWDIISYEVSFANKNITGIRNQ